jgi:hypothetical protein
MKIQHLISRFEPPAPGEKPTEDLQGDVVRTSDINDLAPTVEDSIVTYNLNRTPTKDRTRPRSSSPGRMRKALQSIRGGRGGKADCQSDEDEDDEINEEMDDHPAPLAARVDDVIKSITERPSHHLRNAGKSGSSMSHNSFSSGSSDSEHDHRERDGSQREFSISEHSQRTYIVDNKKVKSQAQIIPDTPWSSRTLNSTASSAKPDYTYYEKTKQEKNGRPSSRNVVKKDPIDEHGHQAEYGEFDLVGGGKDKKETKKDKKENEALPPEVIAMAEASEKQKKKSRRRSRSSDANKAEKATGADEPDDATPKRRSSRRLSPGLLGRRKGSSAGNPRELEATSKKDGESPNSPSSQDTMEPKQGSWKVRKPTRSMSAGRLNKDGSRSPRHARKERKVRSQSPGEERSKSSEGEIGRKTRTGRRKDEKQMGDGDGNDVSSSPRIADEATSSPLGSEEEDDDHPKSLLRTRSRSPGTLRGGTKTDRTTLESGEGDTSSDDGGLVRRKSSSRGRSPGTLRRRSSQKDRSQSPGKLRSRSKDAGPSKSPGKTRSKSIEKDRDRSRSPGKLRSKSKDRSTRSRSPSKMKREESQRSTSGSTDSAVLAPVKRKSRAKSPSKFDADIVVRPPSPSKSSPRSPDARKKKTSGQEAEIPRRKSSMKVKTSDTDIVVPAQALSSKPRARSPGALSRPATTLRTSQVKKSQSLFTPSTASKITSELPASVRRKYSRQSSSGGKMEKPKRSNSSGAEGASTPIVE